MIKSRHLYEANEYISSARYLYSTRLTDPPSAPFPSPPVQVPRRASVRRALPLRVSSLMMKLRRKYWKTSQSTALMNAFRTDAPPPQRPGRRRSPRCTATARPLFRSLGGSSALRRHLCCFTGHPEGQELSTGLQFVMITIFAATEQPMRYITFKLSFL